MNRSLGLLILFQACSGCIKQSGAMGASINVPLSEQACQPNVSGLWQVENGLERYAAEVEASVLTLQRLDGKQAKRVPRRLVYTAAPDGGLGMVAFSRAGPELTESQPWQLIFRPMGDRFESVDDAGAAKMTVSGCPVEKLIIEVESQGASRQVVLRRAPSGDGGVRAEPDGH
jgi:hypothetical protein